MAITHNLYIDQGSTFGVTLNITESDGSYKDLTDFSARSQMRRSFYSSSNAAVTAVVTNAANGEINLSLTAAQTAALKPGRYYYDVEIYSANVTTRILEGIAVINPEVTK